jgi:outer membrane receptor protein involved in Fe transport
MTVATLCAAPALAGQQYSFNIPAQRLDTALIALGDQARISIGGMDAGLSGQRSGSVRGRMSVDHALGILLRGTGFGYVRIDASTFRIVRAVATKRPPPPPLPPKPPRPEPRPLPIEAAPPPEIPAPDIIVTASKQEQSLDHYPGTAHIATMGDTGLPQQAGTETFVAHMPAVTSTNLGLGRNKVFVRGIADSSFSGPTQSTAGLYLGDLRLTYNAPEPDLRLYDVDRIEVVEGPQGTLYGAGSLGGIVRIIPREPDALKWSGSAIAGASVTQGGAPGFDIGGVLNAPLIHDHAALRAVAYHQREGGYINNATDGSRDINRSDIWGGRLSLKVRPGDNWTVSLSGVLQFIASKDSQYALRGLPARTRTQFVSQPSDNDFKGAALSVAKKWDSGLKLDMNFGAIWHDLSSIYDATGFQNKPGVLLYADAEGINLITNEVRLSRKLADGTTWVAGLSSLFSLDRFGRAIGSPDNQTILAALRNEKSESAAFGEITRPISRTWAVTAGGRFVYSHTLGNLLGALVSGEVPEKDAPQRNQKRLLPTAALSWTPKPNLISFFRYQSGFRSGGISIVSEDLNKAQRFAADSIHTFELGFRFGSMEDAAKQPLSGGATVFLSRWNSIQADLINPDGLPFTDNIGNGSITGLEANLRWRPTSSLTLDAAAFINTSALKSPAPGFQESDESPLPNIAKAGGRVSFAWTRPVSDTITFKLDGTLRYVGSSRLGTAPPLLLEQGEYARADISAGLEAGAWRVSLDATNLFNISANSFSYGNPFSVGRGDQITPLRPRTVRLGVSVGF